MLYGKENLHFAATKLNHNSSRSHCLFTVKLIRTDDHKEPTEASMNVMSFVDLAGMERTGKTESRGERLKEAGNINTSLMILGRCIDAMRNKHQNHSKVNIPYRESKLTRILQYFFSGTRCLELHIILCSYFIVSLLSRARSCCNVCECQSSRSLVR